MTRKEAAEMIKNDVYLHHDYLSGEYRKALKLAISALEQPKIIHCLDCKKWIDNDGFSHEHGAECSLMRMWMQPGDYCSYPKRREVADGNTD